jgi:RND family efflux transporter MFP subunit
VVERIRQLGEYVGPGTEVLRLTDTGNVEVVARTPVADAGHLEAGQPVRVHDGAREAATRIRAIIPVGDDRSRMLEVRVVLADSPWAIGSAVRVDLPGVAGATAVVVPRDAVIVRAGGAHVYRIGEGDVAERVVVRVGKGDAGRVEVLDGLAPGDRIVVRGGERLRPGQAVKVAAVDRATTSS